VGGAALAWAAAVAALAGGVQAVTGFGFALLAVPLLSLGLPTETAVVVSATLGLVSSTAQAVLERQHGDRPTIGRMLLGAAVGAPLGFVVLVVTTEWQLRLLLVLVIAAFLVVNLRGLRLPQGGRGVDLAAGLVSGALNSSLSTNGPPLVMALHARQLSPPVFRGTLTAVLAGANIITVALFAVGGRYDADVGSLLLVALPGLGLGVAVGVRHRRRLDPERFRQLVLALLATTGVISLVALVTA
jgi:uncharacterized membrane protein YfcA